MNIKKKYITFTFTTILIFFSFASCFASFVTALQANQFNNMDTYGLLLYSILYAVSFCFILNKKVFGFTLLTIIYTSQIPLLKYENIGYLMRYTGLDVEWGLNVVFDWGAVYFGLNFMAFVLVVVVIMLKKRLTAS